MEILVQSKGHREAWNKGKLVGQKAPLRLRDIWAIRIRLLLRGAIRDLALFNLGIDSKLRLRSRQIASPRRRAWRLRSPKGHRSAAEDPTAGRQISDNAGPFFLGP